MGSSAASDGPSFDGGQYDERSGGHPPLTWWLMNSIAGGGASAFTPPARQALVVFSVSALPRLPMPMPSSKGMGNFNQSPT